ncbi:D-threonine aldolase [Pseudoalteromonas sp. CIP111854]|uniref:D-threonine aldolase n=1 Tax=Pseudoalteromonas holothuriae TaxID=2963714 RepID=A0A9W4VV75_9GAMM|nr:amino acid deaminase [Pseudoalteromonas sp. CIP111854]CAH9057427.1 D-threonine aldolase [Pseudoalteromonas sp. CIP111854]
MSEFLKGSGSPQQLYKQGWNIFKEQVSLPVAVIKQDAIRQNAQWMAQFARQNNVLLAPHGKTTMSPELFKYQLEAGAWAITLANVPQVLSAVGAGIERIILANQLVGRHHFELIAQLLKSTGLEFYCFVDSVDNAKALGEFFASKNLKLNIVLELGVVGGRCGCRSVDDIDTLILACSEYECLQIAGLGFYEGVISGENAAQSVAEFVADVVAQAKRLHQQDVFAQPEPIITGAGSAWYDIVTKVLVSSECEKQFRLVIRPGCYLIHDTGIYQNAQQAILARSEFANSVDGSLVSSLYIWAYVMSVPENGLAIVGMGKRDVAFDAGLPTAELVYSPRDQHLKNTVSDLYVEKIMDQHAMLRFSLNHPLNVGDMVCFSTSHPCLTFDKWRQIGIVERDWVITKTISTHF